MHQIFFGSCKNFPSSNLTEKSDPGKDNIIINMDDFFGLTHNIKEIYEILRYLDSKTFASKDKPHLKFRSFFIDPKNNNLENSKLETSRFSILIKKWYQIKKSQCELRIYIRSFRYYIDPQTGYILNTKTLKEWYSTLLESSLEKGEKYNFRTDYLIAWYRFRTYWKDHDRLKELIEKCDNEPELEKQSKFRLVFDRIVKNESKETVDHKRAMNRLGLESKNFSDDLEIIMRNVMHQQLFHQILEDLRNLGKYFNLDSSTIYVSGSDFTKDWIIELCKIVKYQYQHQYG